MARGDGGVSVSCEFPPNFAFYLEFPFSRLLSGIDYVHRRASSLTFFILYLLINKAHKWQEGSRIQFLVFKINIYFFVYFLEYGQCIFSGIFLAVQNSSIGDLVPCLVGLAPLTIRVFTTLQSDPRDL